MNERVTPDRAVEEIYDRNGLTEAEAGDFVAEKKAEAEKLYTEASNEPVTRNTGEGLSEFAQRKAEHTARVEGLKRNLDKWNQIETAAERRNMTKTGAELTAMDLDARERDIKRQTEERVDELAKKLGDVEKVYDISEVTNLDALAELRAGRTVYGWYDRKKDKVVLYMPNITDPGEATRTIIHEQVIHRGLSKMFKDYDNVLAEVYDKVMTPSEQQAFYEYVNGPKEGKQEDIRKKQLEAADEWIAGNYQNLRFKQYNVWDKIVSSVRGILRKNGFDVDYTRRDIENLVRDSYRNLERNGAGEAPYASAEEGTMLMGSRVNKRMKEVGDIFADRELSDAERSVVDVYSGKADNQPITVTTADGQERRVVMRQGNESGAGTKHSLFRHYNTNSGAITAEDILRIPKIIAEGERKEEGRKVVYELEENGVRYKVLTEIDARREVFANFFTNRRASSAARKTRSEEARDTADDAQLADKVTANSSSDKKTGSDLTNVSENGTRFYKSNENQRIFVSNAEKAVEGIKQEKGTPEQWLKMIEKGGGLKAGEDKWMGLSDWLKEHKGKSITKQEVLDFIRENQIQIEEVKYEQFGEGLIDEATGKLDAELKEIGWEAMCEKYPGFEELFETHNGELVWSEERASVGEYEDFIIDNKIVNVNPDSNAINETRLNYTTEGLDNNREIALTIPTIEPYNSHDEIHFGDAGGGRAIAWVRFGETYSYPVIEHVQKVTDFHEPYKNANQRDVYKPVGGFASGDYVVHGKGRDGNMIYVAYINDKQLPVTHATLEEARNSMNEYYKEHPRKLRKAQRVLVIDEIQSKRHQDGRENGYQTEEFIQTEKRLRELESKPHRTEEENREYRELMNKMDGMLRENPHPVPDAPFAKNWHELAMKRMLKLAAEEGYDKIAWTKGEQQAERYNIGESVKNIEVNAVTDAETGEVLENEFDVYTRSNSNGGGFITEATGRMNTEQIHEIFGKDLGGRIIEGGRTQSNTIIEGDDLRIGGEGMKGFYDKMLPSFMNKYGKKWGTKVGEVELPDVEEAGRTMWSVDVTPEMKESVMQGQTMFSKKNAEREELRESEESKALFDYSKKRFGRTNDLSEAGYILPDGAMLDFSGRHEMSPGSDTSFLRGRRATDHRGIVDIEYDFDGNETGFTTDMGDFLNRGAIRIDGDSGAINLTMKPTPKQKDILRRLVQRMDGDVWIDFGNGWDTEHYAEYTGVKPARVLSDIDKYYDEGIKPEGQTMFSKKVSEFNAETGEEVRFRKREEPDPKKTQTVYKLMRLGEDGKLYPLYIDNASAVELGQWYNADSPNLGDLKKLPSGIHLIDSEGKATSWEDYKAANNLKGKKPNADVIRQTAENGSRWVSIVDKPTSQKRYEGENRSYYNLGINGSGQVGEFAMRPGWHAGSLPTMRQIGKGKNKDLRDDSFVWVEGEVSADKDYQQEAESNPDKDIPTHIPTDGYYLKATNANKKASQADRVGWYVAGAFKPNRIIGDSEARSIIDKWNAEHPSEPVEYDFPRESGKDFEPEDTRFSKAMETNAEKEISNIVLKDTKEKKLPTNREEAFAYIPANGVSYPNKDQGINVRVSRKSVKHTSLHSNKDTFAIFAAMDQIIGNAVKIGSVPVAQDEVGHTRSVNIFYTPINVNGNQYSARLVVKELENKGVVLDELSLYNVSMHKEKGSAVQPLSASKEVGGITTKPISAYKVKDLIHNTQENDKKILGIEDKTTLFSKKRFYDGMSAEEVHDMMGEHAEWSSGPSNLIRELEKHYKGELVSASSGARHAMREGLMPVPGGKYSGQDGEYHHIEFRGKDGETYVESVPFVPAESAGERAGTLFSKSMRAVEPSSGTMFSVRPLLGDKNLHKGLRELKEGEKSHVERVFTENKNFEFSSMNKVESYSDIAYIFRQLEDEAIENSFAVLVKKGKPTVIHLGTGNYTATMVSNSALNVAVNRVNPDKIYFVHNHPSGKLKASRQDEDLLSNLKNMYGPKVADGIIINARSGRYGIYTPSSLHTGADYDVNHGLSDTSNARPIKVYSFSKQVFSPDYQPDALITSSDDVAKFVSSHRLGDRQKLGLIISNNKGAITGNIFLPYSEITKENARDIANDIAYYTSVVGGTRAFMFGNVPLRDVAYKGLSLYVKGFSDLHLLDYVEIDGGRHKSASDEGIRFRFVKTPEEFDSVQKEAVEKKGIVTPGLSKAVVNVVEVPRHDFAGRGRDAIRKAEKWANDNIAKEHIYHSGQEDEFRYTIDKDAIGKFLSKSSTGNSDNLGVHLAALKELPNIVNNSIDVEVHPDYQKKDGARSADNGVGRSDMLVHRMYGAVSIDDNVYRAKTTIHEFRDKENKAYDYKITEVELIVSGSSTSNARTNSTSISAAKLLNGVEKSYDKGKKLLDESETLTPVNKNATFRKGYKAEKAQTEGRLLKKTARTFSEMTEGAKFSVAQRIWNDKNEVYKDMREHIKKTSARTGWNQHEGVISYLKSQVGKTNEAM